MCTPFLQLFHFVFREARLSQLRIRSCKNVDVIVVVVIITVIVNWPLAYMMDSITFTLT